MHLIELGVSSRGSLEKSLLFISEKSSNTVGGYRADSRGSSHGVNLWQGVLYRCRNKISSDGLSSRPRIIGRIMVKLVLKQKIRLTEQGINRSSGSLPQNLHLFIRWPSECQRVSVMATGPFIIFQDHRSEGMLGAILWH
jgi:hypothetical protein